MKHGEQDRTTTVKEQAPQAAGSAKKQGKAGAQAAEISGKAVGRMIEAFMKLPGIGRKSAERLAFAVLGKTTDWIVALIAAPFLRWEDRFARSEEG